MGENPSVPCSPRRRLFLACSMTTQAPHPHPAASGHQACMRGLAVQYKQMHGRVEKRDEIRIEIQAPAGCGDSCVESPPSEAEAGCHKFRTFWTTM